MEFWGKLGFVFWVETLFFPVGVEISVAVQGSRTVHLLALGGFRKHRFYGGFAVSMGEAAKHVSSACFKV